MRSGQEQYDFEHQEADEFEEPALSRGAGRGNDDKPPPEAPKSAPEPKSHSAVEIISDPEMKKVDPIEEPEHTWCVAFQRILYLIHVETSSIHEIYGDHARLGNEFDKFHSFATYGVDNFLYLLMLPILYIHFIITLICRLIYLVVDADKDEMFSHFCVAVILGLCLTTQNLVRAVALWICMPFLIFTPHPFRRLLTLRCKTKFIDTLYK